MDPIKKFIHELNRDAYNLNKNIVAETKTMQKVPLNSSIYGNNQPVVQNLPHVGPEPVIQNLPHVQSINANLPINMKEIEETLNKLTQIEKKLDKFFNLIEKKVVSNAKEINIRIKLNEDSNKQQE